MNRIIWIVLSSIGITVIGYYLYQLRRRRTMRYIRLLDEQITEHKMSFNFDPYPLYQSQWYQKKQRIVGDLYERYIEDRWNGGIVGHMTLFRFDPDLMYSTIDFTIPFVFGLSEIYLRNSFYLVDY